MSGLVLKRGVESENGWVSESLAVPACSAKNVWSTIERTPPPHSPHPEPRTLAHGRTGSEPGSYLRLIDSCITHLKAQGPSRTCNESKEEEAEEEDKGAPSDIKRKVPPMMVSSVPMHSCVESTCRRHLCSGSEAGSYLRIIDFAYHSTLGLRVIKKREAPALKARAAGTCAPPQVNP